MLGCSTGRPASIDHASRTYWACDHASGVAEKVPSPSGKPAPPAGGKSGAQTCSGSISPSFAADAMFASHVRAAAELPVSSSYSPRSPPKIGQLRPIVVLFDHTSVGFGGKPMSHGLPSFF